MAIKQENYKSALLNLKHYLMYSTSNFKLLVRRSQLNAYAVQTKLTVFSPKVNLSL